MNFYIKSNSTDYYNNNEYMEFSEKCCIGCMTAYTHGDCLYLNNVNDTPEEQHNKSILKTNTNNYITSLFEVDGWNIEISA